MNSRERVRAAINHQEPDRVPLDLGGSRVTGIHVDEYCSLARYYGIDVLPPKVYDAWLMLAQAGSSDGKVPEIRCHPAGKPH